MRSGCIHVFEYQPGTNQYRVRQWVANEDMVEANDATMLGVAGNTQVATRRSVRNEQLQLSEGVSLVWSEVEDQRWLMMPETQAALNQVDATWSAPIFFYPDGTTSTARLQLSNQYNDYLAVTLRGLTGTARTEEVAPGEEAGL